ncbi:histone-lysine N-methyltransferase family member SUVH9 [Dorcoceras hygrometricum]|uniref:Histone-lysine N-methyltransferase family member SUVH9 n=1 Tax=Dorcoceras hygrometricum TaxID=472368 RepID=A0A2Z7CKP1_9LAMI|nr:histone-lysine N-methyltransferase family member SUVH9 [Dorcoceras hygrometricum]
MGSTSMLQFQDLNDPPAAKIVPKIEPKLEPLDEPSPPTPPPPLSTPPTLSPFAASDVFSEFSRISEMFRSAFGQCPAGNGDGSVLPEADPDSLALVPVPGTEPHLSNVTVAGARKHEQRSSELVRVTDMKSEDQQYYRGLVRKTRMLYDSLRVFAVAEDEKQKNGDTGHLLHRRTRADLKAAALMRERGLWLNRDKRIVGDIPGVTIGDIFCFRMELCVVGLHGQPQAGIDYVPASHSSNGEPIATSVIVSGGYEDDEDSGDIVIYTGHGGQDKNGKQVMHQKLECGNLALERSMNYGIEVRVIRGLKSGAAVNSKIYVYDGLYRVVETWFDVGKSGFGVFKFKLVRIENQVEMGSNVMKFAYNLGTKPLDVRPKGYVTLNLSKNKEKFPVFLFNDIDGDHDPVHFEYLTTTIFPPYVSNYGSKAGCTCTGACFNDCFCAMKNGGEFAYDMHGTLVRGKPLIFECGPKCGCPPSCQNRVSQKGLKNRFEVFRSRETGWGVRSLDMIQAGSFICEYAGVVLTREQVQIFTMNGDNLIYPSRFADRWSEWGDLSQIFSDYVRPQHPTVPPLDFAMDVSRMRNLACYMSHSSCPNVLVQLVLYDHNNVSFPHLMLFALEKIPPMRELSLDYGVADEYMGKLAICI